VRRFVHPLAAGATFRVLYLAADLKFIAKFREEGSESAYRLVAYSDHGSALLFLKSDIHYDLLLIDHEWRGDEGLKLARLSRSQRHRKHMPIVLLSSATLDDETRALTEKAGVVECALKTADLSELVSRLIVVE
jgi:DNA-binding response OmpR family regulator